LLARATVRAREVAIRLSIGAGRARLVRQFLTESLLYALAGGLLGILLSFASTGAVVSLFDTGEMPIRLDVDVDGRVLAFTIAISVLAGIGFGILPSFAATRVDLARELKEGAVVRHGRRRVATGKALVVGQVALCMLIIAVAGLLVQTLRNLRTFDAGFERDNILLFNLGTAGASITPERRTALYGELRRRLGELPGVTAVAMSSRSPIDFSAQLRGISVPGFQGKDEGVSTYVVTPEYFPLFGIRVLRGRGFTYQDRAGSPPVALVNERMARTYFGSADPIGRTFRFLSEKELATIVGVVEDVRHEQLREAAPPSVYRAIGQPVIGLDGTAEVPHRVTVEIRSRNDPRSLVTAVRNEVRAAHPEATVWYTRTMHQQLDAALIRERLLASLSTGFGLLALLLAFVGLYGVMSYRVARRGREIGVRMALGATRGLVLRQVVRETMTLASVGVVMGLAASLAVTSVVSSFLFGLSPHDPVMFAAVVAMLMTTALVAGFLPARRAASIDPMRALRAE
jgi:predicted permease